MMAGPEEHIPETPELDAPQGLKDDLSALFGAEVPVPPAVDQAILATARRRLARRWSQPRVILRWAAVSAAAACALLAFGYFATRVLHVFSPPPTAERDAEYTVSLLPPEPEKEPARPDLAPRVADLPDGRTPIGPIWEPGTYVPATIYPPQPELAVAPEPLPTPPIITLGRPTAYGLPTDFCSAPMALPSTGGPQPIAWPGAHDEVWIIARPKAPALARRDALGCGTMVAAPAGAEQSLRILPRRTDVRAAISGYIATVDVTQTFRNPSDGPIEATYVFPLPQDAAVSDFVLTVGDRRVHGIVRESQEAERIYNEARKRGYAASLLTQQQANLFAQKVANIPAGKAVQVSVRYFSTLPYVDGWYEFAFPMTAPTGSARRSGRDIALSVDVDAGVPIEDVTSLHHEATRKDRGRDRTTLTLVPRDTIANRDFVVRYRVADKRPQSAFMTWRDARGGFFTLMLYPPLDMRRLERRPLELLFVVECSDAMGGKPLAQAQMAVARALDKLTPRDTFQIVRAGDAASALTKAPLAATPANVRHGMAFLAALRARGSAALAEGLKAAFATDHDPDRLRFLILFSTGQLDYPQAALDEARQHVAQTRIFSFAVGAAPNRAFLEGLAGLGRGAVAHVGPDDKAADVVDFFVERIGRPVLTDIEIDWGRMEVSDVYPSRVPDLFVGRPVVLTGRFRGKGAAIVHVKGTFAGKVLHPVLTVDLDDTRSDHPGLPLVWARAKIADLVEQAAHSNATDLPAQIRQVALDYGLASPYTAFVVEDSDAK